MVVNFLFPRRCLGCRQPGNYFCQACLKEALPWQGQICPLCQKPSFQGKTHFRCLKKYSLNGLIAFFPYRGIIKKAIAKLKYQWVTDLAEELINLTVDSLPFPMPRSAVLVPIPLHSQRQRWRGFNQAEVLGEILAKKLKYRFKPDFLIRRYSTQPQVGLKQKERKKNIRWAFEIKKGMRKPKSLVFLFDDVWTTGSTLKEAGQTLKRRGISEVWGLTLAR